MKKIRNLSRRTWIISSCTAAAAGATLGVLLTAGSGAAAARLDVLPVAMPVPANPVPLLVLAGAAPEAGETQGQPGIWGDRVAHGTIGTEDIWVFTYRTTADLQEAIAAHIPQDGEVTVQGPGISLLDIDGTQKISLNPDGTMKKEPWIYQVPPAVIASRVHGTILPTTSSS